MMDRLFVLIRTFEKKKKKKKSDLGGARKECGTTEESEFPEEKTISQES